jgi:hypothetical protein
MQSGLFASCEVDSTVLRIWRSVKQGFAIRNQPSSAERLLGLMPACIVELYAALKAALFHGRAGVQSFPQRLKALAVKTGLLSQW